MKTTRRQRFDIANAAALRVLRARPIYDSPTWRPGDTARCVCPACDPDNEPGGDDLDGGYPARGENVYRAPVAKGARRLTRAKRKVVNLLKNAQRSELIAWLDRALAEIAKETT